MGSSNKNEEGKVFTCLPKNDEPEKLINQYELEALDSQHRYGRNLRLYENVWKISGENENFLIWLDLGNGKHIDLTECSKVKLQRQRVRYLRINEREEYEVVIKGGMLVYKTKGELVETPKSQKWIYVVSPTKQIYVGQKQKGFFHHSSFLHGGDVLCAGYLVVSNGHLKALTGNSGHYKPRNENFQWFIRFLCKQKVNFDSVLDDENGNKSLLSY